MQTTVKSGRRGQMLKRARSAWKSMSITRVQMLVAAFFAVYFLFSSAPWFSGVFVIFIIVNLLLDSMMRRKADDDLS